MARRVVDHFGHDSSPGIKPWDTTPGSSDWRPQLSVFTKRFYLGAPANGATLYTVPAGQLAIITNWDVRNVSSTAGLMGLSVGATAPLLSPLLALNGTFHLTTRWALSAGEVLKAVVSAGTPHYQVTGYLFDA